MLLHLILRQVEQDLENRIKIRQNGIVRLNRQLKRFGPWGAGAVVVLALTLLFQNCGTYEPMDNPLYDQELYSECLGPACTKDLNSLSLFVGNNDPILIIRNIERSIDLAGYCDTAGYPDSKIYVELKYGSNPVIAPYLSSSKCDGNGRFRVLLDLPGNYNYDLAYTIVLTLRAVDSAGSEYDHPTGVNRRELALLTAP